MTNPLEEFLAEFSPKEKTALSMDSVKNWGGQLGEGVTKGMGGMLAATAVAGVGVAAQKVYQAATKARDFRRMLDYNPDLQEHHERDPRMFNQMFTSLRSMNPNFSSDPIVSGSFMRRMVENPMTAGGILETTLSSRDKFNGPMGRSLEEGISAAKSPFVARKP